MDEGERTLDKRVGRSSDIEIDLGGGKRASVRTGRVEVDCEGLVPCR